METPDRPTSIRLTAEARSALDWLKRQPGGFHLSHAVSAWLVAEREAREAAGKKIENAKKRDDTLLAK